MSSRRRTTAARLWLVVLLGWLTTGRVQAQFFPETVKVKMADGTELATDVWRNFFDSTPRPVLLRRTPYGRGLGPADAANLMRLGFVVVSQDVRGRGGSTGSFVPFFNDKVDGRDTIDWIAAQPWSTGRVATYSASAEGIVQYMAMAAAPDALACSHVLMATANVYEAMFPGGAWRTDLNTSWLTAVGAPATVEAWKAHEARDGYWDSSTLSVEEMAKVDHPVFVLSGFFDIFANDASKAARTLQNNVAPSSRGDVFFVLGPWSHGSFASPRQGELLYPDDAAMPSYVTDFTQYLSWCLLGAARPPFANVRYYMTELTDESRLDTFDNKRRTLARGEWREAKLWPPAETRAVTLHLGGERKLGALEQGGAPVALALDPTDLTPSLGGGNFTNSAGPYDQATIDARPDVYTATSAPVTRETLLVGDPRATIWAASATDDVDVVVRLEVVTPSGKGFLFADGVRRGRFVGGFDAIRPLVPNEPAAFEVELGPIALRLPVGFALRVAISGASSPRYEANPNTAVPLANKPSAIKTTLTLYRDAMHPSRIDLPLFSGELPGGVVRQDTPGSVLDGGVRPAGDAGATPAVRPDARAPVQEPDASRPEDEPPARGGGGGEGCACRVGADSAGTPGASIGLLALLAMLAWRRRPRMRVASR